MPTPRVSAQWLRQLLAELLRSDSELDAFCIDYFRDVYQRFGSSMDRTQKENLLLLHASTHVDIVKALRLRFPNAPLGEIWCTPLKRPNSSRDTTLDRGRSLRMLSSMVASAAGAAVLGLLGGSAWTLLHPPVRSASTAPGTGCGALSIDDLFLVRHSGPGMSQQLALDVRLRHTENAPIAVNITRAVIQLLDKTNERSPYEPSAAYDLLVVGDHNEAALAQRVRPGEVDRMLLRLAFTRETAGFQYTANLQLLYNGGCRVESAPFALSTDAARWPSEISPWRFSQSLVH